MLLVVNIGINDVNFIVFNFVVILENLDKVFIDFLFNKLLGSVWIFLIVVWKLNKMIVIINIVVIVDFGFVIVRSVGSIII